MTEKKDGLSLIISNNKASFSVILLAIFAIVAGQAFADERTQAKRMHDRLTGVVPSTAVLNQMVDFIKGEDINGNPVPPEFPDGSTAPDGDTAAAYLAMENKHFYNATLVNLITPWTNEPRAAFPEDMDDEGTLNDYTATVIGAIRDEIDFRRILYDDILYVGAGVTPEYSYSSNAHYKELEELGLDMGDPAVLVQVLQSENTGTTPVLAPEDTAGVITSRAGAKAFFVDGTNRAMFRFTILNHLCQDMDQLKDVTLPADRIRQDVSRSPGGDSRIYMNACIGCHTGMDPLTQSFAYYDFNDTTNTLEFTGKPGLEQVQAKNLINADNFKPGFIVTDDSWVNYWRQGKNSLLGWNSTPLAGNTGKGSGAKSMAQELAYSDAFARCQVEKVFKAVCLRPAGNLNDRNAVDSMIGNFKQPFRKATGYELKRVFAETAAYCKGL